MEKTEQKVLASKKLSLNPYYNGRYSWSLKQICLFCISFHRLNPYYNGRYSWRSSKTKLWMVSRCLNPYYNGRYSWRRYKDYE